MPSRKASPAPSGKAAAEAKAGGREAASSRRSSFSSKLQPGKATKKSIAADPLTQLKERLLRGERLTEDELVQLELAAVSRYDQLTESSRHEQRCCCGPSTSTANYQQSSASSNSMRGMLPPPPPAPVAAAATESAQQRDGVKELEELRELRELRLAAQKERASFQSTAAELKRLRELRAEVSRDPSAALAISTGRLNNIRKEVQIVQPAWSPFPAAAPPPSAALPPPADDRSDDVTVEAVSSIQSQLRTRLAANHARVLDLFRSWDVDGDGTVRKAEMRRAIASVGIDAPAAAVDALFDSFDRDGGGLIEYHELHRVLRREAEAEERLRRSSDALGSEAVPAATSGSGGGGGGGGGGSSTFSSCLGWLSGGRGGPSHRSTSPSQRQSKRQQQQRAVGSARGAGSAGDALSESAEPAVETNDLAAMIYGNGAQAATGEARSEAAGSQRGPDASTSKATDAHCPSAARSSVSATSEAAKAPAASKTPKPAGKPKKVDPIGVRDAAIWQLFGLIETAAPWAAWHAADSIASLPTIGARPTEPPPTFPYASAIDDASTSSSQPSKAPLPPARSLLADVASVIALSVAIASVAMQGGWEGLRALWPFSAGAGALAEVVGGSSSASASTAAYARPYTGGFGSSSPSAQWPLHAAAALTCAILLVTLLIQLYARAAARCRRAEKAPLLPTAAQQRLGSIGSSTGGGPATSTPLDPSATLYSPWSTIALAELFVAAYIACWGTMTTAATIGSADGGAAVVDTRLLLARQLSTGSAAALVSSAVWRALLVALWRCQCSLRCWPQGQGATTAAPPTGKGAKTTPPVAVAAKSAKGSARLGSMLQPLQQCCAKFGDKVKQLLKRTPWSRATLKGPGKKGALGAASKSGAKKRQMV
jgi:hypothetical protein